MPLHTQVSACTEMRLSPYGCQDTRGEDHDENFTGVALDGTAKAEGVQVMLHLIQRESNTDTEGATQVNNRREGGQEEDEVCRVATTSVGQAR